MKKKLTYEKASTTKQTQLEALPLNQTNAEDGKGKGVCNSGIKKVTTPRPNLQTGKEKEFAGKSTVL